MTRIASTPWVAPGSPPCKSSCRGRRSSLKKSIAIPVLLLWLFVPSPAESAFETIRALSSTAAFDPIRPGLHYWHTLPSRLVDGEPRFHLAAAQPYGLAELRTAAADVTLRPGPFGLGLSCTAMGQQNYYGELRISSAIAFAVLDWLAVGAAAHYGRVHFGERFGPLHEVALGAGLRLAMARKLSFDVSGGGGTGSRPLSRPWLTGSVTWDYSNRLSMRAGMGPERVMTVGETVRLGSSLALATNLLTSPLRLQAGALITAGHFGFDFLYRDDPELGGDLVIGLVIRF